eukprot:CAMPEP_0182482020 /NCGR_PEP_ID=MMETSP1319-20130603/38369_1 /TAXON_ID=172717 /ORGANISM="Bolidomonas pacifica, Strain RCC208" /LENGTH=125 /DNA_ID=CAMNT_0024683695 /DNA_START=45 /DNA_END=418 /DNA_ORIENTATION=+
MPRLHATTGARKTKSNRSRNVNVGLANPSRGGGGSARPRVSGFKAAAASPVSGLDFDFEDGGGNGGGASSSSSGLDFGSPGERSATTRPPSVHQVSPRLSGTPPAALAPRVRQASTSSSDAVVVS